MTRKPSKAAFMTPESAYLQYLLALAERKAREDALSEARDGDLGRVVPEIPDYLKAEYESRN